MSGTIYARFYVESRLSRRSSLTAECDPERTFAR